MTETNAAAPLSPKPNLKGDYGNIALLLVLYVLQAIPMGLFGVVNMEVKAIFKDSFSEQGTFMLAAWPFSLKILWAPLVDSCYWERVGRRKTWMVPAQLAIGFVLMYLGPRIDEIFAARDVNTLTLIFFVLYFLCATQDIAVDGWALTMLRSENAPFASQCNAVGQTIGFTIGFMVPMTKLVSLPSFISFWATVFIATTVAVAAMKKEAVTPPDEELEGVFQAYQTMCALFRRRPTQLLVLHLFTRALAFIPADVMAAGRLQDNGFPKESLANIKLFVTPIEIGLPWLLSRFTSGPRPLSVVLVGYIPRTLLSLVVAFAAHAAGAIPTPVPWPIFAGVFLLTIIQGILSNAMFVSHMAFFAKVSDPAIGGTALTLMNTVHNIGNMWAATFCLKTSDYVQTLGGVDGFYTLSVLCTVYGLVWFVLFRPMLERLQDAPIAEWRVG